MSLKKNHLILIMDNFAFITISYGYILVTKEHKIFQTVILTSKKHPQHKMCFTKNHLIF